MTRPFNMKIIEAMDEHPILRDGEDCTFEYLIKAVRRMEKDEALSALFIWWDEGFQPALYTVLVGKDIADERDLRGWTGVAEGKRSKMFDAQAMVHLVHDTILDWRSDPEDLVRDREETISTIIEMAHILAPAFI